MERPWRNRSRQWCAAADGLRHVTGRRAGELDEWGVDAAYSGTQNASAAAGLSSRVIQPRALSMP